MYNVQINQAFGAWAQSLEFARNAEARVLLCVSSLGSFLFLVTSFDGTDTEFQSH